MKHIAYSALLALIFAITGCTETGTYPVSEEECGPNDPVLDMDASDCSVIPGA
ncbi:hypothetical protein [Marivita geojedonensis]|uniref:hypothetical protein n=1 Tax=Marivita geojedonensis TaxID=1123756 RepID=UPI000D4EAE31|nr:hypothetical protein [Marivita geojedonensis]PRY81513.1 hypothetical protein CLV76_10152 [Marivita geojedonensis]